jgi:hypothetical protein
VLSTAYGETIMYNKTFESEVKSDEIYDLEVLMTIRDPTGHMTPGHLTEGVQSTSEIR